VTALFKPSDAAFGADQLTLLCLSSGHGGVECSVELAGDVALEATLDLVWGLALGGTAVDVGAGSGAVARPGEHDHVDGAVECAVAAAVEAVPDGVAAAGRDRVGATERGECGFVAASAGVGSSSRWLGRR
jgi:hypothetical protein